LPLNLTAILFPRNDSFHRNNVLTSLGDLGDDMDSNIAVDLAEGKALGRRENSASLEP
jgi:hypothetical protein